MTDPKANADPWEEPRRLEEWAEKKVAEECGRFGWRGLLKLLFFGK